MLQLFGKPRSRLRAEGEQQALHRMRAVRQCLHVAAADRGDHRRHLLRQFGEERPGDDLHRLRVGMLE